MRMWEIRENTGNYGSGYKMGMREKSAREAYECGYEDGYEAAMKELEGEASYRSGYRKRY